MRFESLNANSHPLEIQGAYQEWVAANGGDTEANRATAQGYLANLGVGQQTTNDAYTMYKSQFAPTPAAPTPAAPTPTPTPAPQAYQSLTKNSNSADISGAYKQWAGANGGDTATNQATANGYLTNLGIGQGSINDAYSSYKANKPAYESLTKNSNAADIAGAYGQWNRTNGGDTQANRDTAQGYLSNMGLGQGAINDAYKTYQGGGNQQQGGMSGMSGYNPQQNPYLGQMGRDIGSQMFDNWSRNVMPSIRSGAMAAGGFGGSRQGVVEANGMNDMQRQYGQALTSMYSNDWSQQQGRNLQQRGQDQNFALGAGQLNNQAQSTANSYDLGLRSSDLGFAGLDANIAQNNFSNQMAGANFGMNVYNTMGQQNNAGSSAGAAVQNTPLDYQKYFTGSGNTAGGQGSSNTGSTSSQSNPWLGALGGAQMGNAYQYPKP